MKLKKTLTGSLVAGLSVTAIAIAGPAFADEPAATTTEASNLDVVSLLVDGSGPLAEANPGVTENLGFVDGSLGNTEETLVELTERLEATNPDFATTVTGEILSGDPYRVESGLKVMESDLGEVAEIITLKDENGDMTGYCWLLVNPAVVVDTAAVASQALAYDYQAAIDNSGLWTSQTYWLASANTDEFGVQDLSALIASEL